MNDEMNGVGVDDDRPRRARKAEESAETVDVPVRIRKSLTVRGGTKVPRGQTVSMTLAEARRKVKEGIAEWTDPRPDLK